MYSKFAIAFDDTVKISGERNDSLIPIIWKIKKFFGIGSEKRLATAISEVRDFAIPVIREKKMELSEKSSLESADLLSMFLSLDHSDENFITDIVISFILAGRDTTIGTTGWVTYLTRLHVSYPLVLSSDTSAGILVYLSDEVKDMVYTHAAICESMRLYPPVQADNKEAAKDDTLPDGTVVKEGEKVTYHPSAMGRMESVWGKDWAEYRPERWLEPERVDEDTKKYWRFVVRDPYSYPVFQAGPRTCLGKEMAFLQMKRVIAEVLRLFRVAPAMAEGVEPVYVSYVTSKMHTGFPVRIQERSQTFSDSCFKL
ncbi:cytochrome P450 94A1 [Ziziphus jujuba]|uniref:Cytochrome P450 94A1 n=1 Tax=Ziziphus jujuba TaxID=326968 RepID=A0ABM3I7W4_ZIZJJ|nr:cytochrome P450 94A1 [Ziziphus jujuba]